MKIFISYAHEDEYYKDELLKRLKPFESKGKIKCWHDKLIDPGENRINCIIKAINDCELILFLVSPDFLSSDHIENIEKKIALERNNEGEVRIIPVILRHCTLTDSGLSKFQALPKNGKVLSTLESLDEGLFNIVEEIAKLVKINNKKAIEKNQKIWASGLRYALLKHPIAVKNNATAIYQHFGWLIEIFLQKMSTDVGMDKTLRRLSFMAEVFQSSMRYLCYIQIAQILKNKKQTEILNSN